MKQYKFWKILIFLCMVTKITPQQCKMAASYMDYIDCRSVEGIGNFKFPTNSYVVFQGKQPSQVMNAAIFLRNNDVRFILIKNCLKELNPGNFQHLDNEALREIIVINNVLNELVPGIFNHLLIGVLLLNNNQIKALHPGVFSHMSKLYKLQIDNNEISVITGGVFNNLPISELSLNYNRIHYIGQGAFHNLTRLSSLYLSNNRLSAFNGQELFNHQKSISELQLADNFLDEITSEMFKGFENLLYLSISNNSISTIRAGAFNATRRLIGLVLSYNKLKEISAHIFPAGGLQNLGYLNLQKNELSFLSINFLNVLIKLRELVISGNPWQCGCLKIILRWMEENGKSVRPGERAYFKGIKPVCVVVQQDPDACAYRSFEEGVKMYGDVLKLYSTRRCLN